MTRRNTLETMRYYWAFKTCADCQCGKLMPSGEGVFNVLCEKTLPPWAEKIVGDQSRVIEITPKTEFFCLYWKEA